MTFLPFTIHPLRIPRLPLIIFESTGWAEARGINSRVGDAQRFLRSKGYSIVPINPYLRGTLREPPVLESGHSDFVAFRRQSS
ncbi:MAG: hypothetical protein JWO08_2490 [Verrucomicrobiaceae bacterium]|nr:hypothetical protein [Verrucomicrobiaceae bacterium]